MAFSLGRHNVVPKSPFELQGVMAGGVGDVGRGGVGDVGRRRCCRFRHCEVVKSDGEEERGENKGDEIKMKIGRTGC